jgi:5-methylcytosine-specific restriction endonuclease McrA
VNGFYLSNGIIEHKFINTVPAMLVTSGNVISAHYLGVASMFNILPKKCSRCGDLKDRGEFYKDKSKKDGLGSRCKKCDHEARDTEKRREYFRNYEAANREKRIAKSRAWYSKNKEWASEKGKQYRASFSERIRAYIAGWEKKNPERIAIYSSRRRAQKRASGGTITAQQWVDLKEKYNHTCLCCRKQEPEIKLTLDHVKPLKLGGLNVIGNAQPLCGHCNSSKRAKWIDYR